MKNQTEQETTNSKQQIKIPDDINTYSIIIYLISHLIQILLYSICFVICFVLNAIQTGVIKLFETLHKLVPYIVHITIVISVSTFVIYLIQPNIVIQLYSNIHDFIVSYINR